MASYKYDDDYEEMLVEYEQDVSRKKSTTTRNRPAYCPELACNLGGDSAAYSAAALTN